jgi:hypothetical protein
VSRLGTIRLAMRVTVGTATSGRPRASAGLNVFGIRLAQPRTRVLGTAFGLWGCSRPTPGHPSVRLGQ